jgi:hypothetical protein
LHPSSEPYFTNETFAMKNYVLFLFLLIPTLFYAQNEYGVLIAEDGAELDFANVTFYQSGYIVDVTSPSADHFTLPTLEWDSLKVSYIGYKTTTLSKTEFSRNHLIILEENIYNLETIVVSAIDHHCGCSGYYTSVIREERIGNVEITFTKEAPYEWTTYPNPATDIINIKANLDFQGIMEIIDLNNRIIGTYQVNEVPMSIDISQLPAGNYYLRNRYQEEIYFVGQFIKVDL